ncbi:hypothetical protein BamIOP4010DRAFT_2357 [Burkholderia ambifaria IOP40-10]|uniref:Uncharacterized protein n=1 Tax=Burkholderia ambifaria IOP40-10 TaxID=396596 RepID=B1FE97_9BURK|nr:hypothetical protein BamIOP4010DRAFT_2357 [Burkholderia ambifaria IOP40-10]
MDVLIAGFLLLRSLPAGLCKRHGIKTQLGQLTFESKTIVMCPP